MSVYVDDTRAPGPWFSHQAYWSRLSADSRAELHAFAERIGLFRSWFDDQPRGRWHYPVTDSRRRDALFVGARRVTAAELDAIFARRARGGRR